MDVYQFNADTGEKESGTGRSRPLTGDSIAKITRSEAKRVKKQTTGTVAIAESVKDLGTLSCDCGANLCMGGGWWEEKNAHVCKNCKAKERNIINFDRPSLAGSKDEKDVESVGSSGDESEYLPNKK